MSHDSPAAELPKSLQSMIADAQQAIGNWGPEEETDSETLQSSQEWLLRLSRGEFEERLYWECLADDQEEAGDWQGALASHQKILGLPGLSSVECSKAHSAIALIQRLLGDYEAELAARRFPGALAATKALVRKARLSPPADLVDEAARAFSRAALGPEGIEGTSAFLQKRKAAWVPQ